MQRFFLVKNDFTSQHNELTGINNPTGQPELQEDALLSDPQGQRRPWLSTIQRQRVPGVHSLGQKNASCASLHFPTTRGQGWTQSKYMAKGAPNHRCQGPCSAFTVIEAVAAGHVGERRLRPRLLTQGVAVLGLDERRGGCGGRLHLHGHALL